MRPSNANQPANFHKINKFKLTINPMVKLTILFKGHRLWRVLGQHLLEVSTRMAGGGGSHLLWGANGNNLTALITTLGAKINHPIRTTDHIKIVFDHQN